MGEELPLQKLDSNLQGHECFNDKPMCCRLVFLCTAAIAVSSLSTKSPPENSQILEELRERYREVQLVTVDE
ncbi:hypothetical protein TELCIR_04147 [Teladorsagia circumcincta]|uniref:Uncharacterized protein n=1 Tax=Teladorsagia circumcincta TaxID=45464 RepID=A0A2G9UUF8_TELCI|nr:hypothetical protein TELCIR_04147 [Teladorsagia circumcincta]